MSSVNEIKCAVTSDTEHYLLLLFSGEAECCTLVVGHIWWKSDDFKHQYN